MSASHLCGLHEPVQTLVNTLIFAVPRKAKMQTSLATPTNKKAPFLYLQRALFLNDVFLCAERDVWLHQVMRSSRVMCAFGT